jgi:hypothetical protein
MAIRDKVAKSPSLCPRKVQREDWAGISRVVMPASGRDGLPTHTTNYRPKIRLRFHGCLGVFIGLNLLDKFTIYLSQYF